MTFSIVGRCERTGQLGIAISSSSPAVAARCSHARAGVGVVATQNVTDPRLGPAALEHLSRGLSAEAALAAVVAEAGTTAQFRQLSVLDSQGDAAAHTGSNALGRHGHHIGRDAIAAGNLLATPHLLREMVEAFEADPGAELAERLLNAMRAAMAAGGEEGPVRSAGLLVVHAEAWPITDLRVDWSEAPIDDLHRLWELWRPQMNDYVTRALDPTAAPSYGVPGDR